VSQIKICSVFFLLFLSISLITGCGVKTPENTYVLTSPAGVKNFSPPKTHWVLYVNTLTAEAGYKTRNMLYVKSPSSLRDFATHVWVAPPAQMLMPLIIERISSKNFFKAVVAPPFAGASDFRLETRLIVFQQEFLNPVSQVRCIVQAVLINNKTGQVVASRRFQAIVSAPGNNPESGVEAANLAALQISEQIAQLVSSFH